MLDLMPLNTEKNELINSQINKCHNSTTFVQFIAIVWHRFKAAHHLTRWFTFHYACQAFLIIIAKIERNT